MDCAAIRLTTTVLEGKRVEIVSPDLVEGEVVQVFVLPLASGAPGGNRSILEIAKSVRGDRCFSSAAEVDCFINEERASWGD